MELFGFIIDAGTVEIFKHLLLAAFLGAFMGLERVFAHKTAGIRTYALVSMGSALFIVVSSVVTATYLGATPFDPLRIAAGIVTGIGFLGAGTIIFKNSHLEGLTTAAGLWVAAGVGIASGFGLYAIAIFATVVTLFVFTAMWFLEARVRKISDNWNGKEF